MIKMDIKKAISIIDDEIKEVELLISHYEAQYQTTKKQADEIPSSNVEKFIMLGESSYCQGRYFEALHTRYMLENMRNRFYNE